jgi:hypothetical protein
LSVSTGHATRGGRMPERIRAFHSFPFPRLSGHVVCLGPLAGANMPKLAPAVRRKILRPNTRDLATTRAANPHRQVSLAVDYFHDLTASPTRSRSTCPRSTPGRNPREETLLLRMLYATITNPPLFCPQSPFPSRAVRPTR